MTDEKQCIARLNSNRLLIVSNRLPITVSEKDSKFRFRQSVGGLVTGISAYLDSLKCSSVSKLKPLWVGWPGITIEQSDKREELKSKMTIDYHAQPVFLSEEIMEKFYHGFCNKIIWPLFHYFPTYAVYDEDYWVHYKMVNEFFLKAVLEVVKPDDVVWIHDYHLMLLPRLLRERMPNLSIGFFLHIPFPSYEIYRLLPGRWGVDILNGLLGADLIGFHTYAYTQYFLRCVLRLLGHEHTMGQINLGDAVVKAETFPMGIDFAKYANGVSSARVNEEKNKLKQTFSNMKVILSVDRLDYSKGIINRLQGYEIFLEKYPQWHKKVSLILIVVPSRIGVEHYQQIKKEIDELVGKINGRFGSVDWTPIFYQYRYLPFYPLVALYNISDVALITPLRDGMNLIAKEYIACHTDKTGVLILSQMAGAAEELREAIIINPNNREEIVAALHEALEMPREEQIRHNEIMQNRLRQYNVIRWASDFIDALSAVKEVQKKFAARFLNTELKEQLVSEFRSSTHRLIFLDYDGTLVPFASLPMAAKPDPRILGFLGNLAENPKNDIVLISGRSRETIQGWFGQLSLGFVAEHGIWIKQRDDEWSIVKPIKNDWIPRIRSIIEIYVDRLPGSLIEEKEYSIVWHFRNADREIAPVLAKELVDNLITFTANMDVQVLQGSKIVEVRNAGINKGTAAMHWLSKGSHDFVMAIGDDWTDEDIFAILPQTAYSIRVGMTHSQARFNLRSYHEVIRLIEDLTK